MRVALHDAARTNAPITPMDSNPRAYGAICRWNLPTVCNVTITTADGTAIALNRDDEEPNDMRNMRVKLFAAGALLIIAVGYLAFAGLKDGWVYHVDVDQYVSAADMRPQRVRLVGTVSADGFESNPAKLSARFKLAGASKSVPVAYHGAIPELFKAQAEVVVEGRMDAAGVFQADVLMTKCASKYQSAEHGKRETAAK